MVRHECIGVTTNGDKLTTNGNKLTITRDNLTTNRDKLTTNVTRLTFGEDKWSDTGLDCQERELTDHLG